MLKPHLAQSLSTSLPRLSLRGGGQSSRRRWKPRAAEPFQTPRHTGQFQLWTISAAPGHSASQQKLQVACWAQVRLEQSHPITPGYRHYTQETGPHMCKNLMGRKARCFQWNESISRKLKSDYWTKALR